MEDRDQTRQLHDGIARFSTASIGGALVALPLTALGAAGASRGVLFGYLCAVILVLGGIVIRRRIR